MIPNVIQAVKIQTDVELYNTWHIFAWWKWLQRLSGCGRCQPSFSIHVVSTIFWSLLPLFKAVKKLCLAVAIIPVDTQVSEFCRDHDVASLDTQLRIDSLWDRLRPFWQPGTQCKTAKGKLQLLGNDKSGQRESSARASFFFSPTKQGLSTLDCLRESGFVLLMRHFTLLLQT